MASLAQLRDAYRADAAELAKFLDQLCLTLQQGQEGWLAKDAVLFNGDGL